jgi:hypothetical protein
MCYIWNFLCCSSVVFVHIVHSCSSCCSSVLLILTLCIAPSHCFTCSSELLDCCIFQLNLLIFLIWSVKISGGYCVDRYLPCWNLAKLCSQISAILKSGIRFYFLIWYSDRIWKWKRKLKIETNGYWKNVISAQQWFNCEDPCSTNCLLNRVW